MSNQIIDGAEQVFIFNCINMTIKNIHPYANYTIAIQLENTTNSEVTNCKGAISLTRSTNNSIHDNSPNMIALFDSSDNNRIFKNTIGNGSVIFPRTTSDYHDGLMCIQIFGSDNNAVYWNSLLDSNYGISIGEIDGESENNDIYQNNITNVGSGVYFSYSSNNTIHLNSITDCGTGIRLTYSDNNIILQNLIQNCEVSVSIYVSNSNGFYGNNFIDNGKEISERHDNFFYPGTYFYSVNNKWDNGTAGNYWSNYTGVDTDGNGIGDTIYNIFENYTDNYPLMEPIDIDVIPEFPSWTPLLTTVVAVMVVAIIYRQRLTKSPGNRVE